MTGGPTLVTYADEYATSDLVGYQWIVLPRVPVGFGDSTGRALCCDRCGALVGDFAKHESWHGSTRD